MDGSKVVAVQQQQDQRKNHMQKFFILLPCVVYFLVAVQFAQTTYRVRHEPSDLAFMLAAYAMLAMLFFCIEKFHSLEAADPPIADDSRKSWLKLSVWVLSTALTAMFTARIAPMMPPPLNLLVVLMSLLVTVGGFCLLFLCDPGHSDRCGSGDLEACNAKASEQEDKV